MDSTLTTASQPLTQNDIQAWLITYLSQLLDMDPAQIGVKTSFDRFGLDSSATIALISDLGEWLGRELDPTLTYDYSTIAALAEHLAA